MSNSSQSGRHRNAPLELQIQNRGLRDYGASGALLLAMITTLSAAIGWFNGWPYGLGAAVFLIIVSWRSIAPIRFEFGPLGVAQKIPGLRPRRIAWNEMGRVEFLKRGLLITVDPNQPLPSLRGVYIRYCGQRERLEHLVNTYVQPRRPHVVDSAAAPPQSPSQISTTDFSADHVIDPEQPARH